MKKSIQVNDITVQIKTDKNNDDYICLTDMAKFKGKETGIIIANWLTTKYTIEFLGGWEEMHNKNFNLMEFHNIRNEVGSNGFIVSSSRWIKAVNAIGIKSTAGRYGGTYAHKDIAMEFATWLSPKFKLYLIKEFQRLKVLENKSIHSLEWQIRRSLAKTNYRIHTDSIYKSLKGKELTKWKERLVYADEADMLNLILWGKTAKEWRTENSKEDKQNLNIRDTAEITDLIVLSNLETLNARFLDEGKSKEDRAKLLLGIAENQKQIISKNLSIKNIIENKETKK